MKQRKRKRYSRRKRRLEIAIKMAAVVVLITGLVLGVLGFANSDLVKIDLNELTPVVISGYNTQGTVNAKMNKMEGYDEFFDTVKVEFSQSEGLSNGDKVTMTYQYDKEVAKKLGLKIKADEELVSIDGLPDAKEITYDELFKDVEVSYFGIAPEVEVTVENKSQNELLKTVTYEIQNDKTYYDVGDEVVLKAVFDEDKVTKCGYHVAGGENGYTKAYEIKDVDRYITDANELTSDDIKALRENAATLFGDANEFGLRIFCDAHLVPVYVNGRTTFRWINPNYISSYFNILDKEYIGEKGTHINDVKLVYEAAITQDDGVSCKTEVVVRYQNLIKKADGTIDLGLDSGSIISASGSDKNIKKLVRNSEDDKYESVKLNS